MFTSKKSFAAVACAVAVALSASACSNEEKKAATDKASTDTAAAEKKADAETGTIEFIANGEALAVGGFTAPDTTKDGWEIQFTNVYMGVSEVTAHQVAAGYDADKGGEIASENKVVLDGAKVIDLKGGINADDVVELGSADAPAGFYNALSWRLSKAEDGPSKGYTTLLIGTATKDGKSVDFELYSEEEATVRCGEYTGDVRKGNVKAGETGQIEMTYHLDHIFGNAALEDEYPEMNASAYGFEPFMGGGKQAVKIEGHHLAHVGEGHCNVEWGK